MIAVELLAEPGERPPIPVRPSCLGDVIDLGVVPPEWNRETAETLGDRVPVPAEFCGEVLDLRTILATPRHLDLSDRGEVPLVLSGDRRGLGKIVRLT